MRDLRKTDTHVCMDDSTDKRLRRSAREGARLEGGRAGDLWSVAGEWVAVGSLVLGGVRGDGVTADVGLESRGRVCSTGFHFVKTSDRLPTTE